MFPWIGYSFVFFVNRFRAVLVAALFVLSFAASSALAGQDQWQPIKERLVAEGFDKSNIDALFRRADIKFDASVMARKINALLSSRLRASATNALSLPQPLERYLNPILLAGAYAYLRENSEILQRMEHECGVSEDVVVAVFLVETKLGRTTGETTAFTVLANMALAGDFSLIENSLKYENNDDEIRQWLVGKTLKKGEWAFREFKALLSYAEKASVDPVSIPASFYGAIGLCQFMPTSALSYGKDGNGDGVVDLFNESDALFSIANFLREHGWKNSLPRKKQLKVIYAYNHSMNYALTILAVADRLQKIDIFFGRN